LKQLQQIELIQCCILPLFAGRTLPVTTEIALCCVRLNVPDLNPYGDGLIAATALVNGLTVVTRNEADFSATDAAVLNPWNWIRTR
jgi:predicted nucleic acid-binding protein